MKRHDDFHSRHLTRTYVIDIRWQSRLVRLHFEGKDSAEAGLIADTLVVLLRHFLALATSLDDVVNATVAALRELGFVRIEP